MGCSKNRNFLRGFPGTIRDLLKLLCEKEVTIILDAEEEPEHVEIEAVIGDLLVAEFDDKFKFIDINCICAVIVDREDILESIFDCDNNERQ
jgi:class 3 adenylate cyclase